MKHYQIRKARQNGIMGRSLMPVDLKLSCHCKGCQHRAGGKEYITSKPLSTDDQLVHVGIYQKWELLAKWQHPLWHTLDVLSCHQ